MPSIETSHATIYDELHGRSGGPVVVFAHGAGGNRLSWWQQAPAESAPAASAAPAEGGP